MAKENLTIHTLMKPSPNKAKDRSVWGLPLQGLWIPFFTATNTVGESRINAGALGCPLRLSVGKDGVPKLKDDGTPRYTVDKEVGNAVKVVKDNFAFGLMSYAMGIQKAMPAEYKTQVEANQTAGAKVLGKDQAVLDNYLGQYATIDTPTESKDRELVAA